ncbi:Uncharacterised protein [Slackia heliotrinireducens]|nr:hypothetical protein [Slackia heliotrinireducens]VEH01581.1 Uncharacterised protein [Slackia heliotrinireducens]
MMSTGLATSKRTAHSRIFTLAVAIIAAASMVAVEALHGHACTGDGCVLCLAAGCAQAMLGLCIGITVARPVLRIVWNLQPASATVSPIHNTHTILSCQVSFVRSAQTPVSLGTMLRI